MSIKIILSYGKSYLDGQDKRVLVKGKSKCKDPEAGTCQHVKNKEANVTTAKLRVKGWQQMRLEQ